MSKPPADQPAAELRRRAEAQLQTTPPETIDAQRKIHDLQIHLTKLEKQNEELLASRNANAVKSADLYDFAPVSYLTLNAEGSIQNANLTACSYLGIEHAHLLEQNFTPYLSAADRPVFATFLQKIVSSGGKHECEVRLPRTGEPPRQARLEGLAMLEGPDQDWRCRVVLTDLTGLKEAEEQLETMTAAHQKNAEEKEAILNALPGQIALLDPHGLVVTINEGWGSVTLPSVLQFTEFVIGQNYLEVCERSTGNGSKEAHAVAQGLRAVLSGQQRSFALEYSSPSQQEQRWSRLTISPASTGRHTGAVIMHVDITKLKMSQKRRLEEQGRLANLIDSAMDAIVTIDAAQTVVHVNPAAEAMFGSLTAQIVGHPLTHLVPARFGAWLTEDVWAFGSEGASNQPSEKITAISGIRADGQEFPIEASMSQVEVGGEKFYTAILRDGTRRLKAETELQSKSDEMRALARRLEIIHDEQAVHIARELHDELGQTLTILKLHVGAMQNQLEERADDTPSFEAHEAIQLIETSFKSLRRLCSELRPPILDHLGLGPALKMLAADFQTHSGISCTLEVTNFPLLDAMHQATIYRLVQELLNNVVRHAGATIVRIILREMESTLELKVVDNGRGITDAEQTGRKSLGLLGMRERAMAAGGTITFIGHSGQGTTARAVIPLASLTPPPDQA
ncbi:MAG: PAS domain S-box-containing protein [Paracoccaceae bacterium]|jgi:two-component system sensor kinase